MMSQKSITSEKELGKGEKVELEEREREQAIEG
jgi:hypothetical protein